MARMFGLVDSKVQEAAYFLNRVIDSDRHFYGVQHDAVAFAAAARSVTFALQSSLSGVAEFDSWYEEKQQLMRNDPLARFFNNFRRVSQHIGVNAVAVGSMKNGKHLFFFGASPDLKEVPELDVASACSEYFKTTLEIVYDCYLTFNTLINGQWRFTKEHFSVLGKSIEDAEEELGFPRGWSQVSDYSEDTRWFYLRKSADDCCIQDIFMEWLGKLVPHPDDETHS